MSDENEQEIEETVVETAGAGNYLRQAREEQQLTQQQVASELRMQVRTIEALENDDYESLPGSTFTQGYLRSYARLLGLDEENIVALGQQGAGAEVSELRTIYETSEGMTSSDLPVRMVSYLVVLVAVVGIAWWLAQKLPLSEDTALSSQTGEEGGDLRLPVMSPLAPLEGAAEGEAKEDAATDVVAAAHGNSEATAAADTHDSEVALDAQANAEHGAVVPARSGALQADGAAPTKVVSSEEGATALQPDANELPGQEDAKLVMPSAPQLEVPPLTAQTPQAMIELDYQADSWTEITDAAGRQLVYSLVPAGKNLVLRGEAPFKVFLGYAPGVNIYYNGDLYDHSPYQRGDVARFRIGRAEHNRPLGGN